MLNLFKKKDESEVSLKFKKCEDVVYSTLENSFFMYDGKIFYTEKGRGCRLLGTKLTLFDYMKDKDKSITARKANQTTVTRLELMN